MQTAPATPDDPLLTADRVPLMESLQISLRRRTVACGYKDAYSVGSIK